MRRVMREHMKDIAAIVLLFVAGLFSLFVVLSGQKASLPSWVPVLGVERFELKAELSSAQAVTPGQGQSVDIAGIRVGDITDVQLQDGHAVVTMQIDDDKAELINQDASMLLRPKTGLNDMVIEVDPGVSSTDIEQGATIPLSSTRSNVNPDEILAALDGDTQGFLALLLNGGGEALGGDRGPRLGNALRRFEPFARDISKITGLVAQRRDNVARSIHNFRLLSEELGNRDQDLTSFVDASNAVLARFANQRDSIESALRELPGTLRATNGALGSADRFALTAAPALRRLLPSARALKPALVQSEPFFRQTVAPIRDQIRPFTRQVRGPVRHLTRASVGLQRSVPDLRAGFRNLNVGLNAIANNPAGPREGFLFFIPWLNHNLNAIYTLQDAHGPMRRGPLLVTCQAADLAEASVFPVTPYLNELAQLTGFRDRADIC